MNPSQIVRLAICIALMVAPLHAEDEVCASYADYAFNVMIRDMTDVNTKCGSDRTIRNEYYYAPTKALCAKPGCVEELKKASMVVPDCFDKVYSVKLGTLVLAAAKMCENEGRDGNLPAAGSGSLDIAAGSLGSNDTIRVGDLPFCSEEEINEINELEESKEHEKACGKSPVGIHEFCSRPACMTYYKDTVLPKSPDCLYKSNAKLKLGMCDALRETAPSSSVTTIPGVVLMVVVAIATLILT
ncbi:hypothetical protein Poli38472_007798 [Pythium oligandrum]|uniref:Uncharacterized protein n=1 Tax=Pythium oligandrum TaxID=41045 RepID=A0A8K1CT27_PYTOL|nr:hypothetical protein Poli38472_007798 [Pythium oligandrum]|eukprot:TMW68126.1 hypothetical protein Poli38472_007798 [Pythium oligandrum]